MKKNSLEYIQAEISFYDKFLRLAQENYRNVFKFTRRGDLERRVAFRIVAQCRRELDSLQIRADAIQFRKRIIGR